jgi:DNA-binding NarL/FixJ family response regulator
MSERIPVYVEAEDPLLQAGVSSQVRACPRLLVVDSPEEACIAVAAVDAADARSVELIRSVSNGGTCRVLAVVGQLDDAGVLALAEAGASGILRRSDASQARLAEAVEATAAGNGTMPPDLLARLLSQVGRLQRDVLSPRGIGVHGLSEREVTVLRLVAEGHDTGSIAREMAYSERTVKNVIHDIVSRLNLRNRSHAVAYAVREGII